MALILNIESATNTCSVALAKDGKLLSLQENNEARNHAEVITVYIQEVLNEAHISFSELDAIAVSKGPGSYTGLRIGVSTAKGLCYALNKPLIAINTLQAMTLPIFNKSQITNHESQIFFCPMLDARRMEVYCALLDTHNHFVKETSAEIIDEQSFAEILKNNKVVFFGDGAAKCKTTLAHHANAVFIDGVFPSARNMMEFSEAAFRNKQFEDVAYFEPFYLKDFMATTAKKKFGLGETGKR